MRSSATTVDQYLSELPDDRRSAIEQVRSVLLKHLPEGLEEVMNWGMITYQVPWETCSDTYNNKPLMYAALANQKNYMAVYICGLYCFAGMKEQFEKEYRATGKKLDMGASCVRFKTVEDLPLDIIGTYIGKVSVDDYIKSAQKGAQKK